MRHLPALLRISAAVGLTCAFAACRPEDPPIGRLAVEPAFVHLAYPRFHVVRFVFTPSRALPTVGTGALAEPPIVFVHLLDRAGEVIRTFDHELPRPWREESVIDYDVVLHQSAIAPALPPGEYRLSAGLLVDGTQRVTLEVAEGSERVSRGEYVVATIDVPAVDESLPMFYFSSSFRPVERTLDEQHPAVRWFAGESILRVGEVAGAGEVFLGLRIPPHDTAEAELRVEAGAIEPAIWITSPCSGREVRVTGAGRHDVRLPLERAPDGSQGCEVRLAPNFRFQTRVPGEPAFSALLEVLSWSASSPSASAALAGGTEFPAGSR